MFFFWCLNKYYDEFHHLGHKKFSSCNSNNRRNFQQNCFFLQMDYEMIVCIFINFFSVFREDRRDLNCFKYSITIPGLFIQWIWFQCFYCYNILFSLLWLKNQPLSIRLVFNVIEVSCGKRAFLKHYTHRTSNVLF